MVRYVNGTTRTVNPVEAGELREHAQEEWQRPLSDKHVRHLCAIMAAGEFYTGHVVIAENSGHRRIANGQHTLAAIQQYGNPVRCHVENYEFATDSDYVKLFHAYDTENKSRSHRDCAHAYQMDKSLDLPEMNARQFTLFRGGVEKAAAWGGLPLISPTTGDVIAPTAARYQTKYNRFALAVQHRKFLNLYLDLDARRDCRELIDRECIVAAVIVTADSDFSKAATFWGQVVSGFFHNHDHNDPAVKLNHFLRGCLMVVSRAQNRNAGSTYAASDREIYVACIRCWNAHIEGRTLSKIQKMARRDKKGYRGIPEAL